MLTSCCDCFLNCIHFGYFKIPIVFQRDDRCEGRCMHLIQLWIINQSVWKVVKFIEAFSSGDNSILSLVHTAYSTSIASHYRLFISNFLRSISLLISFILFQFAVGMMMLASYNLICMKHGNELRLSIEIGKTVTASCWNWKNKTKTKTKLFVQNSQNQFHFVWPLWNLLSIA